MDEWIAQVRADVKKAKIAAVVCVSEGPSNEACVTMEVPLLSIRDPDFDDAYALLSCAWVEWLQIAHCVLRLESTHIVARFSLDRMEADRLDTLLKSINRYEAYLA